MPLIIPQRANRLVKPRLGVPVARSHPLARGLQAAWLLNEGGGATARDSARAGPNVDGTIDEAVWTPGPFGPTLQFDAVNDAINVSMAMVAPWSLVAKICPNGSEVYGGLFTVDGNQGLFLHSNKLNFYFGGDHDGTTALTDGLWYHVVVTIGPGTTMAYYINGRLDATFAAAPSDATYVRIGTDTATESYGGRLDHLLLYRRALTASEAASLAAAPYQFFAPPAWQRWPLQVAAAATASRPVFQQSWRRSNRTRVI